MGRRPVFRENRRCRHNRIRRSTGARVAQQMVNSRVVPDPSMRAVPWGMSVTSLRPVKPVGVQALGPVIWVGIWRHVDRAICFLPWGSPASRRKINCHVTAQGSNDWRPQRGTCRSQVSYPRRSIAGASQNCYGLARPKATSTTVGSHQKTDRRAELPWLNMRASGHGVPSTDHI